MVTSPNRRKLSAKISHSTIPVWSHSVMNFIWSPVFFGAHRIGLALAIIVALLAAILSFIATAWPRDRVASWLFVPYAAWVTFATALNAAVWRLN